MNKYIQTLIEREACEHWSHSNYKEVAEKAHSENDMCKTSAMARKVSNSSFQSGAHFALSLFKWRKVSEGLPEEYITVLIKNRTGKIMSVYRCDVNEWCIIGTNDLVNPETIEYWMPIPQID